MITAAITVFSGAVVGGTAVLVAFCVVGFGWPAVYGTVLAVRRLTKRRRGKKAAQLAQQYRRNVERAEERWNNR